jgi:DNA mismatch endonuclease (patch repair protein)
MARASKGKENRPPASSEARRNLMRAVRQKDTAPEMRVRRALHALGLRYRLNVEGLPGRPDLVFPKYGCVLFVHGCFWHGHRCRHGRVVPRRNAAFWLKKIATNRDRDSTKRQMLRALGWRVLTVWECQIDDPSFVYRVITRIREPI